MRRASSKLLFHIPKPQTNKTLISLISRDFSSSIDISLHRPFHKSQSFLFPNLDSHGFWPGAAHNFNTLAGPISSNGPQLPIKEKSDLFHALISAESVDEMLEAFKSLETCVEGKLLGLACLRIGLKLHHQGEDPEKALSFAQRALKIFDDDNNENSERLSYPIAVALNLLGLSSLSLKRFNDSLGYFNRILNSDSSNCDDERILTILRDIQSEMFIVKTAMGRREEAIAHLKKVLEIKEKKFDENSEELGDANLDMAEAYVAVLNFKEALPFCSKALDIHKTQLGSHDSGEVAYIHRLLGIIYTGLDEHEKALEQNQLSRRVLKNWVQSTDLLRAEINAVNMSGQLEETIEVQTRAIFMLKGTLTMLEKLPSEQHSVGSVSARIYGLLLLTARLCRLLLLTTKVEEAIPFLEDAAERLKERFGSKQFGMGYVYNNLGAAYLVVGRPQSAAQVFAHAKEIMEVTLGLHHMDTIEACRNLSKAYAAMGSYPLAINFQEKVVEGLEGHGPSAQDELDEAVKVLEQLKEKEC